MKKKVQKEFICEQDRLMAAFAKVNLREAVTPIVRGKVVEDTDTYNKVQQMLDCPEMEHAHKFLLDVDFDDLTPEMTQKVDDLYQLAISNGYIKSDAESRENEDELADEVGDDAADIANEGDEQPQISDNSGGFEAGTPGVSQDAIAKDSINATASDTFCSSAFVLFYSAMKNGQIKTGECYSNATTMENAKLDAIQKLKKLGFTAIDILAAEESDPSAKGCDSRQPDTFGAKAYDTHSETNLPSSTENIVPEAAKKEEADNIKKDDSKEEEPKDDSKEKDNSEKTEEPEDELDEEPEEPEEDSEEEQSDAEEDTEEPSEKKMSRGEKLEMFKKYLNEFKNLLQKMKAETYIDMSLADRAKFYDEMSKIWDGKPDPMTFMTDDNVDQIEHMKIKLPK